MSKKKQIIVFAGVTLTIAFSGWAIWIWSDKSVDNGRNDPQKGKSKSNNNAQTLAQTSDPNSIPLTESGRQPRSSGGLSVDAGSNSNSLGQLSLTPDKSSESSKPASNAEKMLDPKTFSQYDKYKGGESALFAELQVGTGVELAANKKAAVLYKGWLTNGQLFDMSRANEKGELQPFVFTLGARQVIQGWEQSLAGMKVGGVRFVIVPPAVGYGPEGQDPIPGNSVLIFQVQLLAVE